MMIIMMKKMMNKMPLELVPMQTKVKIGFYDCTAGKNYNYTTHELGIPSNLVTKTGHREVVEVWLNGNNEDYIFVDFDLIAEDHEDHLMMGEKIFLLAQKYKLQ